MLQLRVEQYLLFVCCPNIHVSLKWLVLFAQSFFTVSVFQRYPIALEIILHARTKLCTGMLLLKQASVVK